MIIVNMSVNIRLKIAIVLNWKVIWFESAVWLVSRHVKADQQFHGKKKKEVNLLLCKCNPS